MTFTSVGPAVAAGNPDEAKGIVVEHCVGCHEVPGLESEELRTPTVAAVSFQTVADDPETYTPARLREFLLQPHWPMGQYVLSSRDIDNLLAFIKSLRRN